MSTTFTATVADQLMAAIVSLFERTGFEGPMPGIASIMAVTLACVFILAAVLKLKDPSTTAREFRDLRIPGAKAMVRVVAVVELLVAGALLVMPTIGAVFATVVLLAFTAVLVATIRSGLTVSCGCLGATSSQPVTIATVARNLALMAMAAMAATSSSLVLPTLVSVMVSATLALLATLVVQLLAVRHQLGRMWSVELAGEAGRGQAAA